MSHHEDLDRDAPKPEESSTSGLEALSTWRDEPVIPTDRDEADRTRRAVVGRMQAMMREEQSRRARRRRISMAVLVAAIVCLSAATAFGLRALSTRATAVSHRKVRGETRMETAHGTVLPSGIRAVFSRVLSELGAHRSESRASVELPLMNPPTLPSSASTEPAPPPLAPSGRASGRTGVRESPASELAEQNRLFQAAMAARKKGNDQGVVRFCDQLLNQYPDSPLAAEAKSERTSAAARLSHGR